MNSLIDFLRFLKISTNITYTGNRKCSTIGHGHLTPKNIQKSDMTLTNHGNRQANRADKKILIKYATRISSLFK